MSSTPISTPYPESFKAFNPATGEQIGEVPCTPLEDMPQIFEEARKAQKLWAAKSFNERKTHVIKIRDYLIENADAIAKVISQNNGKTEADALNTEILPSVLGIDWYAKKAKSFLKPTKVAASNVLFANKRSNILRIPYGVVGIISPWNYPFGIPVGEIIMGLMAGNAIIYRPAQETPLIALEIEKAMKAGDLPHGLCKMIMGNGPHISTSWFENNVDKIFFTGSVPVGKHLMKQAASSLTPISLELGGNDAMIVLEDANLERAANGAVWAGFQNSGQTCAGVERIYVQESIADKFLELVKEKTEALRQGADTGKFNTDVGAMTTKRQLDVVKRHVKDALAKGATIVAQATIRNGDPESFYPATVLVDVNHDMQVMQEETFGPLVGVMTFKTEEEAIVMANDSDLGLTSSVWTMDNQRGRRMAERLETGITTINDHVFTFGAAETPWVGWKNSGMGVSHSGIGLQEMTKVKVVNYDIAPGLNADLWWFPHLEGKHDVILNTLHLLFGTNIQLKSKALINILPRLAKDPLLKQKFAYMIQRVEHRTVHEAVKAEHKGVKMLKGLIRTIKNL